MGPSILLSIKGQKFVKKGQETKIVLKDLTLYHQNLPKKQVRKHSHPAAQLFFPLKGDIWVNQIRVAPGKMFLLQGNTIHNFEAAAKQGERMIATLDLNLKATGVFSANSLVKELMFHMLADVKSPSAIIALTLLKKLLNEVSLEPQFDVATLHSRATDERVVRGLELIEKHLDQSLTEIAKAVGTSSKTFTRLFQDQLGVTPKQVQSAIRIDSAQAWLSSGKLNVTETAFAVGFNSLSAFIKSYKARTGRLPSQHQ